ncbi:MAG: hypothetical protein Tsb0014_28440 [Pleurocapsa sp.]
MKSDRLWLLLLFIAAVILYTFNLGELPLRDWDEGTVAGVARNIWRGGLNSNVWLHPTINYDQPYWNKPPLIHWLIAISYSWFGISEWSSRIIPALLSAISVPLVYKIAEEVFRDSPSSYQSSEVSLNKNRISATAIFSALVYLTLLPMVRHGRLAMLDGAIALWLTFTIWCLLRSRYFPSYVLGVGTGLGLICLTKGMMMGVLLGAIAIIFTVWDAPKLVKSSYFWGALFLGTIPAIAWYVLQYLHYGQAFLGINLGQQTFNRIWQPVSNTHPPWYYLVEITKYTLPWLLFLPGGIKLAIKNLHSSWAKLTLVWSGIYLLAISVMVTKLPWYVIPIYPAFALLVGANLGQIWQNNRYQHHSWQKIALWFLSVVCWAGSIYYGWFNNPIDRNLQLAFAFLGLGLTVAAILLGKNSRYFAIAIITGLYCALLLLFNSQHWVWELAEAYPVKPVAAMLQQNTPPRQVIYTTDTIIRPSLEFYSDRVVRPLSDRDLPQLWQQETPVYLLVNPEKIESLGLENAKILGNSVTWQLITRSD